jgi:tocopherol cyclase
MKNAIRRLRSLYNPEQYHGWGKKRQYFEGWYYKVVNANEDQAFAFIPGIAMDGQGQRHAFIQVMDGMKNTSSYLKFEAKEFQPDSRKFSLQIADNFFQNDSIHLNNKRARGRLEFRNQVPWPVKWNSPGIMGPYAFVPFMECYHGILSMDHEIIGSMVLNGEEIDFTGGRGYMEKDWGVSFPSAYIWMQSNHFSEPGTSLKLSVANIPWLGSSFVGFIAGFWWKNELIEFTTYNSSNLLRSSVNDKHVEIELKNKKYILKVKAERTGSTELASPILGFMEGKINESMTSKLAVQLVHRQSSKILFEDVGRKAGLEVAGAIAEIMVI